MCSWIVGLSSGYHDSAVALLKDGDIIAALQEERFSRVKQDARFPANALRACLRQAGVTIEDVETVFYYENPAKKFARVTTTYLDFGLRGWKTFLSDYPSWLIDKPFVKRALRRELREYARSPRSELPRIEYVDHHEAHAASAFFAGPYSEAAILCIDGVGEWATTSAWVGSGNGITPLWEIRFPHSLGLLYSAMTYFCGFKVDSGEYKLMGLAPYGDPVFYRQIVDHLIDVKPDGSFWLNMDYFDYAVGNCMVSERFEGLFGGPRRQPESPLTKREFDLAASIQKVLEEAILRLAATVQQETGQKNLCMAGGVALNCVANGKLLRAGIFDEIWVQPAAGDSGGALGAALAGWHVKMNAPRPVMSTDRMQGSYLGTSYGDEDIEGLLRSRGAVFEKLADEQLLDRTACALAEGNVVGWFQGRMEFGPRALGSRSILGDPRNPSMQSVMNLKIKYRESFRPFAPAVLEENVAEWFDLDRSSPYMLFVVGVHQKHRIALSAGQSELTGLDLLKCVRSTIPAVTHVDHSARVQTVSRQTNPRFHALIDRFHKRTGCPALINTSFNVRGEPIVESPANAYTCFMRTEIDHLVMGNYFLHKADQPKLEEKADWRNEFALD
jgi:carbamoyltransferase